MDAKIKIEDIFSLNSTLRNFHKVVQINGLFFYLFNEHSKSSQMCVYYREALLQNISIMYNIRISGKYHRVKIKLVSTSIKNILWPRQTRLSLHGSG